MAKSAADEYADVLEGIQDQDDLGGDWLESLDEGDHTVVMTEFRIKKSKKTGDKIVEADFSVLESNVHQKGDRRGWAWFINAPGWTGKYAKVRNQEFIATVGACVGDARKVAPIGGSMLDREFDGVVLEAQVRKVADKDSPGQFLKRDNGTFVLNAKWFPIDQTKEDIKTMAQEVKNLKKPAKAAKPAAAAEATSTEEIQVAAKKPNRFSGVKL